jgi:hypothetical protein
MTDLLQSLNRRIGQGGLLAGIAHAGM